MHNWWESEMTYDLVSAANNVFLFGSVYLCELRFPAMTDIKTKY